MFSIYKIVTCTALTKYSVIKFIQSLCDLNYLYKATNKATYV